MTDWKNSKQDIGDDHLAARPTARLHAAQRHRRHRAQLRDVRRQAARSHPARRRGVRRRRHQRRRGVEVPPVVVGLGQRLRLRPHRRPQLRPVRPGAARPAARHPGRAALQVPLGHRVGLRLRLRADHDRRRRDLHLARPPSRATRRRTPTRWPATPTRSAARPPTTTASPAPAAPTTPAPRPSTARPATPRPRCSSTTATTSATWPAPTTARCGSATPPTRVWPGPAGSSTTSRSSRPSTAPRRCSTRATSRPPADPSDPAVFNGGCQRGPHRRRGVHPGLEVPPGRRRLRCRTTPTTSRCATARASTSTARARSTATRSASRPGLYLSYTDEAHGYGNAGTDDPPAQSPLDSVPTVGSATPDLNDAAFKATPAARSTYSETTATPHVDNYADPGSRLRQLGVRLRLPGLQGRLDVGRRRRPGEQPDR